MGIISLCITYWHSIFHFFCLYFIIGFAFFNLAAWWHDFVMLASWLATAFIRAASYGYTSFLLAEWTSSWTRTKRLLEFLTVNFAQRHDFEICTHRILGFSGSTLFEVDSWNRAVSGSSIIARSLSDVTYLWHRHLWAICGRNCRQSSFIDELSLLKPINLLHEVLIWMTSSYLTVVRCWGTIIAADDAEFWISLLSCHLYLVHSRCLLVLFRYFFGPVLLTILVLA